MKKKSILHQVWGKEALFFAGLTQSKGNTTIDMKDKDIFIAYHK